MVGKPSGGEPVCSDRLQAEQGCLQVRTHICISTELRGCTGGQNSTANTVCALCRYLIAMSTTVT